MQSKFTLQDPVQIQDVLAKFVVQLEADGRSRHTIQQYQRHAAALTRWLESQQHSGQIEALDHEWMARFLVSPVARSRPDQAPKKATSVNALRTSMRCLFGYAEAAGYAQRNPGKLIRRARCGVPAPKGLSEDHQAKLLAVMAAEDSQAARRDRVMVELMLATGIRLGSAVGLNVEDLDFSVREGALRCTKGDQPTCVTWPEGLTEGLKGLVDSRASGPLFADAKGRRISPRHVQRRLDGWAMLAGIARKVSPHVLRHTFAMKVYRQTGDLLRVQQALGHRSVASAVVYARVLR